MANANAAFGFKPVTPDGQYYTGVGNRYFVPSTDSTALFIGDPVIVAGTSVSTNGVPTITRATAGSSNYTTGVIIGFEADDIIPTIYRPASTNRYVLVADDPDLLFEVQEDADGGALAITGVAANANFVAGSGSTVTGLSGFQLDSSTVNTTNTLQLRIERFVDRMDNEVASANAKLLVRFNLHSKRNLTGV